MRESVFDDGLFFLLPLSLFFSTSRKQEQLLRQTFLAKLNVSRHAARGGAIHERQFFNVAAAAASYTRAHEKYFQNASRASATGRCGFHRDSFLVFFNGHVARDYSTKSAERVDKPQVKWISLYQREDRERERGRSGREEEAARRPKGRRGLYLRRTTA